MLTNLLIIVYAYMYLESGIRGHSFEPLQTLPRIPKCSIMTIAIYELDLHELVNIYLKLFSFGFMVGVE